MTVALLEASMAKSPAPSAAVTHRAGPGAFASLLQQSAPSDPAPTAPRPAATRGDAVPTHPASPATAPPSPKLGNGAALDPQGNILPLRARTPDETLAALAPKAGVPLPTARLGTAGRTQPETGSAEAAASDGTVSISVAPVPASSAAAPAPPPPAAVDSGTAAGDDPVSAPGTAQIAGAAAEAAADLTGSTVLVAPVAGPTAAAALALATPRVADAAATESPITTAAKPAPVVPPAALPPVDPAAGRTTAAALAPAAGRVTPPAVPVRATGTATAGSGTVRISAAASGGVALAQPALLLAVQEQAPPAAGDQANPATTVNQADPSTDQGEATTVDPMPTDPVGTFAAAIDLAPGPAVAALVAASPPSAAGAAEPRQPAALAAGAAAAALPLDPAVAATAPATTSSGGQGESQASAPATPAGPTTPSTLPAVQLALAMTRNLAGGAQSFTMQLNPERLGAVDVKLSLDAKGRATASFVADRPETLALLRQDAHHLVQSLNAAGVDADAGSLSFSLRDSSGGFEEAQERRDGAGRTDRNPGFGTGGVAAAEPPAPADPGSSMSRLYDIRA
jgi:flagellar hook-length control protein FliK